MANHNLGRRDFLRVASSLAAAAGAAVQTGVADAENRTDAQFVKAVQLGMLPEKLSDSEKFALAKDCGYAAIEAYPMDDLDAAAKQAETAKAAGVPIHSIVYGGWDFPLSSPDPAVVEKGLEKMGHALQCAQAMGAEVVLLVPALVNAQVRYVEAYERSQKHIRTLLPAAEKSGVIIGVENVWNNFLLSPIEFAQYVDAFQSPWLRAYFDVGNVVAFGWPQDWILTLGKRIVRVHLKDFRRKDRAWTPLREGDVDWPVVRQAFKEVGYRGYLTTELPGGDEEYLRDVSRRVDAIIEES